MKDHRLIDERSLALHRLVAEKLRARPALLEVARANIKRWEPEASPRVQPALTEWRMMLDGPFETLLEFLESNDALATRLRQSSPFAGVLTEEERLAIFKEFQARESVAA